MNFDQRIILGEQVDLTKGKIWYKKTPSWKGGSSKAPWGWGFYGHTFFLKDIFNKITTDNNSAVNAKNRFYWNKDFKCWWTVSDKSMESAKKFIAERTRANWNGSAIDFMYKPNTTNLQVVSPTINKELENLKQIWGQPHTDKSYNQEASTLDANNAWDCPVCGTAINKRNLETQYSKPPDSEITHWFYKCAKCFTKLTIWND